MEKRWFNSRKVRNTGEKSHCTIEGNSKNIGNTMVVLAMMQHHETPINTNKHQ
jgi:hypothetical protein